MEFDVIVVGAGAGGCIAAARLAAAGRSVLLIEAGGAGRGPLFSVPLATGILLRSTIANWSYATEPEPHLNDRRLKWPRGRVLGGSTAINGMVWMRGQPGDYRRWAAGGLPGWGWDEVRPVFESLEAELRPGRRELQNPMYAAFLDAARSAGHALSNDFNRESADGAGPYDFTIREGRRVSAAQVLQKDGVRERITIRLHAVVTRLLFDGRRCTGVEVGDRTGKQSYRARRVVLAAGVVGTPHLMMLSGLGPADQLREAGVDLRHDMPGIGQNLQDHLLIRVMHETPYEDTIDRLRRADRALLAGLQAWATGKGPAAGFPIEVGGLFRSQSDLAEPDLQASFMPGLSTATLRLPFAGMGRLPDLGRGYFANIFQMRPASRGEIRLTSSDPAKPPRIIGNYLSASEDLATIRAGVRVLREIFVQPAWGRMRGGELQPGPNLRSDADIDAFIRSTADTVYHPAGTCRMGPDDDPLAVLDPNLGVRGIDGLTVADASAMPVISSSNTAAPTMMIGARAADFILNQERF